jgi:transcriptional repressor NrdR
MLPNTDNDKMYFYNNLYIAKLSVLCYDHNKLWFKEVRCTICCAYWKITMRCPYCNSVELKVVDKRDSGDEIRRRRECLKCGKRFTTYERVERDLFVIKKDGKRERFLREKLFAGVETNLQKRPFSGEQVESIVSDIEAQIYRAAKDRDVRSCKIGQIVMRKLKSVDKVAYVRFAAVYREFADVEDFKEEIKKLK